MGAGNGNNNGKPFDLRPLLKRHAGTVLLDREEPYPVRHLDAPHWRVYERVLDVLRATERGEDVRDAIRADEFYELATWCVPDAVPDLIESLPAHACGVIIGIAAQHVKAVEESDPNAGGPAGASPSPA